ncbi:metal-dependent hydrolase [Levilactobacillus namurensis DSM 19117]|uniref:Endoribonuclease YbeY n=2 Tax=Levilactobacillus namurensis TaxID=380393 RepID=A0A0R1K0U6_9LACO|nr:rRNA maturation RNase YbeY [Levilactobacillus namurensis]PTM21517.1 rRNA maturation RNase YbeY [Lactobacillus sp. PFC-70]KRK76997.1 metal-dependent hydrolase [Levilactobacillus namurensis DSM 19117]MCW3777403.1 rRNA maturation RNase YbeY [Levilactobacillus namurensis]MDT7014534.1 rRNA maturation RNase YbeY [Levilactobacillus namurensis]MDT7018530.1 rRNA maturation RNase YbeY [Levilactobacillus namurensis]
MDLEIYDKTKTGVPAEKVQLIQDVLQYAGDYLKLADNTEMSVTLMNNEDIHRINKQYRGVDRATDVISFAIEDDEAEDAEFPLVMDDEMAAEIPENIGDIFVSMDKVSEQAEYLGHSYDRELGFLVVHGFLHLNGYDHMEPEDEKVMFKLQADILDAYGLKR